LEQQLNARLCSTGQKQRFSASESKISNIQGMETINILL